MSLPPASEKSTAPANRGEEHVGQRCLLGELLDQTRLPDPSAAADQHGPARPTGPATGPHQVEQVIQLGEFAVSPHEAIGHLTPMKLS